MLEDKFIDYISPIKSPYEEDELDQEDVSYDGYMQYFRDCIIKSIGTNESSVSFDSYWDEFIDQCGPEQKTQFLKNCLNKIIKTYKMSYITALLEEKEYEDKVIIDFIKFYAYKRWLKYYPKCLSFINDKLLYNQAMLKIFITSDYNNFVEKLTNYKSCNELIIEYYKYCSMYDGIDTLVLTLKDDLLQTYLMQMMLKNKQ